MNIKAVKSVDLEQSILNTILVRLKQNKSLSSVHEMPECDLLCYFRSIIKIEAIDVLVLPE